jgi:hypothetical protein
VYEVCAPQKVREAGVGPVESSSRLTILSLQLGPLAGEIIDRSLGLLSLAPMLIHLIFQGPAHFLQVSLREKGEKGVTWWMQEGLKGV